MKVVFAMIKPMLIHTVIAIDDLGALSQSATSEDASVTYVEKTRANRLRNVSIYVGNDADDHLQNALCPGSPFLTNADNIDDNDWPFGIEAFCNLEG